MGATVTLFLVRIQGSVDGGALAGPVWHGMHRAVRDNPEVGRVRPFLAACPLAAPVKGIEHAFGYASPSCQRHGGVLSERAWRLLTHLVFCHQRICPVFVLSLSANEPRLPEVLDVCMPQLEKSLVAGCLCPSRGSLGAKVGRQKRMGKEEKR